MSISVNSPIDETLNRGPPALLLRRLYEFPFGIDKVQFSMLSGLSLMHFLTAQAPFEMRADIEKWDGTLAYANHINFYVGPSSTNYTLNLVYTDGSFGK